jgi:nucleoside 2-deoxyribosyltransferase
VGVKIYLAARYSKHPEMREAAAYLAARGHEVTSRWINGSHELGDHPTDEARRRLAVEDCEDLRSADVVIAFSEAPRTVSNQRGGRHVEFGMALALGKPIYVVGPKENVFHYLPGVCHFRDLVGAAHALDAALEPRP